MTEVTTGAATAAARAELLRRRLFEGAARRPAIGREPRPARPALSLAQERLWFIERLYPGTVAYSIPVTHRLRGGLDMAALDRALGAVVARHESLRTRFGVHAGQPYQVIDPPGFELPVTDLSADEANGAGGAVQRARSAVAALAGEPFDLTGGPLFRARLLRLAERDHVLFLSVHHSVFDGWSLGVLQREISAAYRPGLVGSSRRLPEPPLPDLPVQYADYAAWQRRELTGDRLAADLSYWRTRLAGAPLVLELPADRRRPPQPSYRAGRVSFRLDAAVTRTLRELGRAHKASLFMVTLSAYQALLGRHTRMTDLIVGSSVSGRSRTELEPLIGFFVNSLALRCDLRGDPSFSSLLDQVQQHTLDDFAHQELPLGQLVEELAPPRDLSRSPVLQVWFNVQNAQAEIGELLLDGLAVSGFDSGDLTTRFDLELHLTDGGERGSMTGGLIYASDLFDHRGMAWFAGHYVRFLTEVARDPAQRLSRVPILTPDELALFARLNNPAQRAANQS